MFVSVGAWELVLCVALCCLGLGVCVCVYVPSHLKHSRQGSLCLSWFWAQSVCCCVLCGCVCVCSISAQTFETRVFMFELRSGTVCVGCVLCGCVCARSISAQAFETGVFMFELRSWIVCVWLCAVCVCVCVYVPSQLKHSRHGSLCLSWAGQRPVAVWLLVPIPH